MVVKSATDLQTSNKRKTIDQGDIQYFTTILGGHIHFQTLATAVKFDLFSLLDRQGSLTQSQIANLLNIQERPTRILLLGLVSLKILNLGNGQYSNSLIASMHLVKCAPKCICNIILWQSEINYQAMSYYYEATLTGKNVGLNYFDGEEPTLYQRLAHAPQLERIFQNAMAEISNQANDILAKFVDFSKIKTIVDIGGGNGTNIINLAQHFSSLKGVVFDSKTVCLRANENFSKHNLNGRCSAIEGDCFLTQFPTNVDAVLFCHFLTIWSADKNLYLLKKAYDALPIGGSVFIFNMMQNDHRDGPLTAAMGSPYFLTLATSEGMLYTWQEYKDWMTQAGFEDITSQELPMDHGVIIGTKLK